MLGTIIEGPSSVTYLPGLTSLPIELTCSVTGVALWIVNNTNYRLSELTNGTLHGHNRTGTNILVNNPVNNTEYICVSLTSDGDTSSNPAYIIIAGECNKYIFNPIVMNSIIRNITCNYFPRTLTATLNTLITHSLGVCSYKLQCVSKIFILKLIEVHNAN